MRREITSLISKNYKTFFPMKTRLHISAASRYFSLAVALTMLIMLGSCGKKISFLHSTVVPGAEGLVKIKQDNNKNYALDISVVNLAQANDLTPPKNTYVVWMETEENGVQNIGQINSSSGLFSKAMKASLQSSVPYKPTKLFITAEDEGNLRHPGMQVVLETDRFNVH